MFFEQNHWLVIFLVFAITAKFCTGFDFDCDFESNDCGFRQITSWGNSGITQDYNNWVLRARSSTPERQSGPTADHTTGSGYYMVFHAYAISSFGSRAIVYKDITVTRDNTWISFWYHMYTFMEGNAQFKVYAGNTQIFFKRGNQGKGWKKAEIKLNVPLGSLRLSFLAIKGSTHYANVGVDDIIVAEYWKPNITSLTAKNNSVCLNNNVELECTANGYPPSEYSFYVNNQFVRKSYNGKQNIQTNSEGNAAYRCEPTNAEGSGQNATIEITTNPLPNVLLPTVTVIVGSTLNLFCNATGNMPFQYIWKLGYSASTTLPPSTDNNYTKPGITRYDNKYFRCMPVDRNGCTKLSPRINIDIQYPPRSTSFRALQAAVCLNNMASFSCWASANPRTIDYGLYLDGQQLLTSRSTRLTFNSTRVGSNTYVCQMNNSVGFGPNGTASLITKAPPQIRITLNQTVAEGTRLVLECNVSGSDPMTVTWRKVGGSAFPNGNNITFERLTTADHGGYECTASNGNECPAASSRTFIHVQYKPRQTNITISNSTVCLNDLVVLECTTDADPPVMVYSFFINDQLIQSSGSSRIQMNSTTEGNNTYRCQPRNSVGLGANATVFMNTKAPPNITWLPPNQSIAEGSKVLFPCNVTGSEPMNIRWKKVGQSSSYLGGHILTFNSLMKSHDGGYECSASNGNECPSVVSSSYIDVLYPPTITTFPRSVLTLYENGTINLDCKADGNPSPNITWTRASAVIGHGGRLVLTKEQSAQAIYTCVASNGVGANAEGSSNVVVKICENVCQNNNTCVRRGTTWRCDCRRGLVGRYCEKDDPVGKKFEIKIVLTFPVWKDEYSDSTSNDYKDLEKEICYEIQVLFIKILVKCKLKSARKGSIITETELEFNKTKTQSEIEGALSQAASNGTFGRSLKVDVSASFQAVLKDNMCETKPCLFDGECMAQGDGYKCDCKLFRFGTHCEKGLGLAAGIIIIIVVFLIVIVTFYVIVHFCCIPKKHGYHTDSLTERDIRMGSYKVKNGNHISSQDNNGFKGDNTVSHVKENSVNA